MKKSVTQDIYYVGVNDRNKALFEGLWPLPNGVSYNSYLIDDEQVALIDTVEVDFFTQFIENIQEVIGSLSIDYAAGCASLSGEEIHLTPIEYRLLCLLAKNTGKVLTHNYILKEIWGSYTASDVGSLRVFMATLRKKLQTGDEQPYIQTHIGIGYRMLRQDRPPEDMP